MTIRPCVVVPVYDHGAGAVPLLERLAPLGLPLVLVNDGSAPDCTAPLRALAARHAGARLQRSWAAPATGLSISTYVPFALQRAPQRPGSARVLRAMGVTISTLSCDLTRSRPGRTIAGRALLQSTRWALNRLGFRSLSEEVGPVDLPIAGKLPHWLDGALLRTGPALFKVEGSRYRHWFDGLPMLYRFGAWAKPKGSSCRWSSTARPSAPRCWWSMRKRSPR